MTFAILNIVDNMPNNVFVVCWQSSSQVNGFWPTPLLTNSGDRVDRKRLANKDGWQCEALSLDDNLPFFLFI